MMKLKDFIMEQTATPPGVQLILDFDKYQLSIIKNSTSYGNTKGLWEIGVFENGSMKELPGVTNLGDTVKGFLSESEVDTVIKKMYTLTGVQPTQV